MPVYNGDFVDNFLSRRTPIFGLHLWGVIGFITGAIIVLILFLLFICINAYCRRRNQVNDVNIQQVATREEIVHVDHNPVLSRALPDLQLDIGRVQHRQVFYQRGGLSVGSRVVNRGNTNSYGGIGSLPEVPHVGWGKWYTLREIEAASNGLSYENAIGDSEYGIVYYGVLPDNTEIAIKNLFNNRHKARAHFEMEVGAIDRARHKNIVRLLGLCVEGTYRMIVYEYVGDRNLDQWLHGEAGDVSPLTWEIRMNILLGCAKGLAYLHGDLQVIHRDIKSGNILLDKKWNAKLSNFGLAPCSTSNNSPVTTEMTRTLGYDAPEFDPMLMMDEKTDVYAFGILIMEIITGKSPVEYRHAKREVNLDHWIKMKVRNKEFEEMVDPKLPNKPSTKSLKRAISVAQKCVDLDVSKRPNMGHVVRMLEAEDLLSRGECGIAREPSSFHLVESTTCSQSG